MSGEFELIEKLKKQIPARLRGRIGIGDDTGVFAARNSDYLFTTDVIVEGVDFLPAAKPEDIGRKALAVNLSDIAAMGGRPTAFVVTLGIPRRFSQKRLERCYSGMMRLAREYQVSCLGGDITRAKDFFISIALIGESPRRPFLRSAAKAGDLIGVTGELGGSISGKQFNFTPRLKEAAFLRHYKVRAAIDISDGLVQDLEHILQASRKGARLELNAVPVSSAAKRNAGKNRSKALLHALSDGEDFELLFTVSAREKARLEAAWKKKFPRVQLSWIGKIQSGKGIQWQLRGKNTVYKLKKKGYTHF